jgi:hypothetical protein
MNVSTLLAALHQAVRDRAYFTQLVVSDQSQNVLKARLYLAPNLFVQVYRNDRFDTTNLVVVHNDRRIFGRDQLSSRWHRHPVDDPASHDFGPEGQRGVDLREFLDEVESVLTSLGLP